MNMKTTKFLAVLAVFAMAFAGFAVVASGDNSDAAVTYDKKLGEFEISNSDTPADKVTLTLKGQTTLNADIGTSSTTITGYTLNTKVDSAYNGTKFTGSSVLKLSVPTLGSSIKGISFKQTSNAVGQLVQSDMNSNQVLDLNTNTMTSWFASNTFSSGNDFEMLIPQDGTGIVLTVTIYKTVDVSAHTGTSIGSAQYTINLAGVTTVVDLSGETATQSLKGNKAGGWAYTGSSNNELTLNNFEGQVAFLGKITTVSLIGENSLTVNLTDSSPKEITPIISDVSNAAIGSKTDMSIKTKTAGTLASLTVTQNGTGFGITANGTGTDLTIGNTSDTAGNLNTVVVANGGDRGIFAQENMTIDNAKVTATGSERAIHVYSDSKTLAISGASEVTATIKGSYLNNAGVDDIFGVKVGKTNAGALTLSEGSVLKAQGLRVTGTITLTNDGDRIYVSAGYTQNPKAAIDMKIAGLYADKHATQIDITKKTAAADADAKGIYFIGDVDFYTPKCKTVVTDESGEKEEQYNATDANGIKSAIDAAKDVTAVAEIVVNLATASEVTISSENVAVPNGKSLEIRVVGAGSVSGTMKLTAPSGGTDNTVTIDKITGSVSFAYGSIVLMAENWTSGSITLANNDVLKVYSTGRTGITGNVTVYGPTTEGQSARILVESGETLTVSETGKLNLVGNLNMNNDGSIVGRGTIDVGAAATFYTFTTVSVYLTGEGTIITEDSMEDVEISGYLTSSMTATPTQRVIVTGNLTIRSGEYLVITGELVVPEGVTVSIEEGGLLMLTNPTAHAKIEGTVKASGKSAVAVSAYNNLAAFTVNTSANKVPVEIYGSVIAAKATADNVTSVALLGLTEIYGDVTVNTKATANFAANAVVEVTGKIVVNGTFSGTISNEGLIEINGAAALGTTINMAAADAQVDVKALKSADALTITDFGMYLMTVEGVAKKVTEDNDNTITLQNVGGLLIEEDIIFSLDSDGNRAAYNFTYMSGITGFGDSKVLQVPTINVTEGKYVYIADELDLVKTVLNINADVYVTGTVTVNNDETFVLYGQAATHHADINVTGGETTVTGMMKVTGNSLSDTTEEHIVAVKYTNRVDSKDVYYYTTLKTAIDSGEKDFEVLKKLLILEDTIVPAGVTVDATGKDVDVGSAIYGIEPTLTISDGANLTAKKIEVIGTLYIANVDTGINCSNIISDTSSFGTSDALYTNLYNALYQADSGDVVKITSKTNVVKLTKDSVIKTGVTLIIPGSKTLKLLEGTTLTVNGFLQNKGTISAYYMDGTTEKAGTFAEKAKADATTHAASIKVNGMIESTTSMPYADYKIPGAYYTSKTMSYITTVDAAALVASSVDGCKVDIYGTLEIGEVAFMGTESKNLEINVYGVPGSTTAAPGTFTVGEMGIAYGAIKFKTANTLLNGTFGTLTGAVKMANVMTTGTTSMISDYIYADGEEDVSVMAIQGSFVHSGAAVDAKKAPSLTFDGDVAVRNDLTFVGLYDTSKYGSVKVDTEAAMGVFNGAILTITDAPVTIDGSLLVFGNAKTTIDTTEIASTATLESNTASVTVNGTFIAADGSYEDYAASSDVVVKGKLTAGAEAIVGGKVVPYLLTVMPGATVIGELLETISAPNAAYTEFYVEKVLWKTVYLINGATNVKEELIQNHQAPGLKDCVQDTYTKDDNTYYVWGKTDGSSTKVTGDIGTANKVYAYILYDIYKVVIYTDAGVKSVSIDNKVLASPESGKNVFETLSNLKAGVHKVSYTLKDGYEGQAVLYTADHTILKDLSFETSGTEGISGKVVTVTLELSGTEPIPEPEPTPTPEPEKTSEWNVTTILLLVLVILIAIMAVIVALRLNRN